MKFSSQGMLTAERASAENMTISLTDPFPSGISSETEESGMKYGRRLLGVTLTEIRYGLFFRRPFANPKGSVF